MADKCANCDCSDKSQCVKGNQYSINMVEDNKSYNEGVMMEGGENCDKCQCGNGCACTNCTCCSH